MLKILIKTITVFENNKVITVNIECDHCDIISIHLNVLNASRIGVLPYICKYRQTPCFNHVAMPTITEDANNIDEIH